VTLMQMLIQWLNASGERSVTARAKRQTGSIIREVVPRWPGLSSLLIRVRAALGSPLVRCEVEGVQLWVDARDQALGHHLLNGFPYEQQELDLVRRCLQPGRCFLDVGANIGYFTVLAAKHLGPSGRVVAFEPEPRNFEILKKNVDLNGLENVRIENYAAVDREQNLTLYLSSYNFGDHRIFDSDDDSMENRGRRQERVQVRGVRLDEYLREHRFAPDFIKIDVQGAEQSVLMGLAETLSEDRDIRLLLEFWPHGMRQFGTDPVELLKRLDAQGFRAFEVRRDGTLGPFSVGRVQLLEGPHDYCNVFASRRLDQLGQLGIRVVEGEATSASPRQADRV
jgi:FkbM family methyltransferase